MLDAKCFPAFSSQAARLGTVALVAVQLGGCACWSLHPGHARKETTLEIVNAGSKPLCGVYIWRPENEGGTGMVATSPELNNWLQRGTYLLDEEHPKVFAPGERRAFKIYVRPRDRLHVQARDCEENIVVDRRRVCLLRKAPLRLESSPEDPSSAGAETLATRSACGSALGRLLLGPTSS